MDWKNWLIVLLVVFTAGWMLFDGTRALITGDYTTPSSGEYAGQLGPWSNLVKAVGIEPRSTLMKSIFVAYGLIALAIAVCFVLGLSWARSALMAVCILGLWFLPIGTLFNLIALILLFITRRQRMPQRERYPMPDLIRDALKARGVMNAYQARPPYQQNDYIGWITRARLEATRQKRLDQMLDELERGGVYMKMKSSGSQVGLFARLSLYMAK